MFENTLKVNVLIKLLIKKICPWTFNQSEKKTFQQITKQFSPKNPLPRNLPKMNSKIQFFWHQIYRPNFCLIFFFVSAHFSALAKKYKKLFIKWCGFFFQFFFLSFRCRFGCYQLLKIDINKLHLKSCCCKRKRIIASKNKIRKIDLRMNKKIKKGQQQQRIQKNLLKFFFFFFQFHEMCIKIKRNKKKRKRITWQ